jgi:adenine-specific DNA-methyltransferase
MTAHPTIDGRISMPRKLKREGVDQYIHDEEKRLNNPPVGLVSAKTDALNGKKTYEFDPHLDPQLQWSGKTEGTNFEVDTVSLHVHERIDPLTVIQAVKRKEILEQKTLFGYFETDENNPPIREAIDFYKHSLGWSNRLVAGDSLLVMNSLIEKEGMAGKVQMAYIDPPYGIRYGSNFQPFVNKREVKDGKDEDLTQQPEMVKAFRDTWELGIHSYLTYLRDRFLLVRALLSESGSVFVQISSENLHHVRELMDEVFGAENFVSLISFQKTGGLISSGLVHTVDYICWYAKDRKQCKIRQLYLPRKVGDTSLDRYDLACSPDGQLRRLTEKEFQTGRIETNDRRCRLVTLESGANPIFPFEYQGKVYNQRWKTNIEGLKRLAAADRIRPTKTKLFYLRFVEDFPLIPLTDTWESMQIGVGLTYVVQTSPIVIQRCMLMTTDPGDLVFDPTCGSGTTAYAAEQWGRRWITCDTSRVAITLAKQRMMTSIFDYYVLAHKSEGVSGGFAFEKVRHVTLGSVANAEPRPEEIVYDDPLIDSNKKRVSGPFTVEAVPAQKVRSFEDIGKNTAEADSSIARAGETSRLNDWIDELLSTGIRGKGAQAIEFARVEPLGGTRWIQAGADTKEGRSAVVSFGSEYAPLEQRQIELAIEEAQELVPKPNFVIFAAFQFDPEAAKDIDELKWPGVNVLKVQMNADLFTRDLKKNKTGNESFWLVGQPDVEVKKDGKKHKVIINGFDYYNSKTGAIESGDASKIAMWELDTDYDGRSLYPRQVFFPLAGADEGWSKLAKTLRAFVDEDLLESYRGNESIPFLLGESKQVAVKIIDDRGIESLKVMKVRD